MIWTEINIGAGGRAMRFADMSVACSAFSVTNRRIALKFRVS
jgi:hypothetical protein